MLWIGFLKFKYAKPHGIEIVNIYKGILQREKHQGF